MPIDPRRRDDIAAAVAAYDRANPKRAAAAQRRTAAGRHVPAEDVCQRSLDAIAARRIRPRRGFLRPVAAPGRGRVPVQAAGLGVVPNTYRLHLPPVRS